MHFDISGILWLNGATGLYKPVGGAGACFCTISSMLHIRGLFSKLRKTSK